ncbi:phage integrase N-terminal SAM-like domain-containing protein [Bacillus badius]|uniref:site-specific integrase n=1 Tax=Bacillus badius TaxID=1455 RepID=UPI002E1F89C0|nr:site-specific integrase [Bacillus badius]MED0665575.1 phage integrase N-terminal SAM-like domain-containing protein [Bacillus badius]
MNELLQSFEQWLMEEGKASKTIESYVNDVKGFQQFFREKAANEQQPLSRFSFGRYKQFLLDQQFAVSTMNKKMNSLKVYNGSFRVKGIVSESYIQLERDTIKSNFQMT